MDGVGATVEEKLENEIYQHTGIMGQSKQLLHLIACMNGCIRLPLGIIRGPLLASGLA